MKLWPACLTSLLLLFSCGEPRPGDAGDGTTLPDTSWMGDLRITATDTTIRLCGSAKRYRLSGPALDTIADRYRYATTMKGQWAKLWCSGHLGTITDGSHTDSALLAVKYQHLDASLHCDPVPDPRVAGSYVLEAVDPDHPRSIIMDLFPDGRVTMYSDLYTGSGPMEEDGRWGVDANDRVNVDWPRREQTMQYEWDGERLNSEKLNNGAALSLRRTGEVDAARGVHGRVARWLAQEASAQGRATRPGDVRPSTPLDSLFPTEAARERLTAAARDTLHLNDENLRLRWAGVTTVRDVVNLLRSAPQR